MGLVRVGVRNSHDSAGNDPALVLDDSVDIASSLLRPHGVGGQHDNQEPRP